MADVVEEGQIYNVKIKNFNSTICCIWFIAYQWRVK
jgi:hypothetical protein